MSFTVRVRKADLPRGADARLLARAVAQQVAVELSRALREGIHARTGAPRRRKPDGSPEGYATGRLARSIHATQPTGTADLAQCTIVVALDRARWVAKRRDVLVVDGRIRTLIQETADAFARALTRS